MDFPFKGIPTVPPRKDNDHMVWQHALSSILFCLFPSPGV